MTNPQYGGLLDAITEAVDIQAELDCSVEQARVVSNGLRPGCGSIANFRTRSLRATSFRFDGSTDGLA